MKYDTFQPDESAPLHAQIREWLLDQLAEYALDEKLPTDRKLASALGVSPLTIKRAMADLVRDGFVVRQQGRGTFLASRERKIRTQSERAGANGEIILAYPNYYSYEYWARAHAAENLALKSGHALVEFKMNPTTTCEALIDLVRQHPRARGLMIAPVPDTIDRAVFDQLDSLGIPVVLFSHCDYLPVSTHVYSVVPNQFKAGYLMMDAMIKAGHRAFGHVNCEPSIHESGDCTRGMKQALKDAGLPVRSLQTMRSTGKAWEDSAEIAYKICAEFLHETSVTALMVDSINGAIGCQHYLWKCGLEVPQHISLITSGTITPQAPYMTPPITAVHTTEQEEMEIAFDIVMNPAMAVSHDVRVDVTVLPGQSVAAPYSNRQDLHTAKPMETHP